MHHGSGAVTLGSEMSGGIRNIVVSNIMAQGTQMGINIKSDRGRGGVIENVRLSDFVMDDVGRAINVTQYYALENRVTSQVSTASERTPVFRNIAIDNISINHCRSVVGFERGAAPVTINIEGLPEMPISGLRISNVISSGKNGLRAHDTVDLELHNVQVNADSGPAFLIRDSKDLELESVSTRNPLAGVPVIRLDGSPGAFITGSRAFQGTGTFLSLGVDEKKNVLLEGNALDEAREPIGESPTDFWKDTIAGDHP
jgi:polygalacturonase